MATIKIDLSSYKNLKVDKDAGQDNTKPLVLKELRHEILDIVSLIFQKSKVH